MSNVSNISLIVFIVIQLVVFLVLGYDGLLVLIKKPSVSEVAQENPWVASCIFIWLQAATIFLALHLYA